MAEKSWLPSTLPWPPNPRPDAGKQAERRLWESQRVGKRLPKASTGTCHKHLLRLCSIYPFLKNKLKEITPEKSPVIEFRNEPISLTYKGKRAF